MNILPKKKWHVRTKDNVARVRRDEAKAADEERQKKERAALAEQEYRTKILRERAAERNESVFGVRAAVRDQNSSVDGPNDCADSFPVGSEVSIDQTGHVNFFAELEADERKNLGTTNKEYEAEKKQEKEAEEKKIGLLKYLGEGSSEFTKEVPWYQRVPEKPSTSSSSSIPDEKPTVKLKQPEGIVGLTALTRPTTGAAQIVTPSDLKRGKRKLKKEKKKLKKERKSDKKRRRRRSRSSSSSSSSSESDAEPPKSDIAQLRAERLRREAEERSRADAVIRKARGLPEPQPAAETKQTYKQRYNSQFNPEMARQNRPD